MTDYQTTLLIAGALKVVYTVAGVSCVFMGFKLFTRGIQRGGAGFSLDGNQAAAWKAAIAIDKGGPGLLFALFGAAITIMAIARDISVQTSAGGTGPQPVATTNAVMNGGSNNVQIETTTVTSASIGQHEPVEIPGLGQKAHTEG